ncbi:MAG: hypothetical protein ACOCXM_10455 [Myxococcota bacterium]
MTAGWTRESVLRAPASQLEAMFAHDGPIGIPAGAFRGRVLCRLDNPGARRLWWRGTQKLGFEWLPFGVDFSRRRWFFFGPALGVGRFEPRIQASRWRDTRAVALHYDPSGLPGPVRRVLYDEVKPLGPDLVLGLGGIHAGPGLGDHFFFLLERP